MGCVGISLALSFAVLTFSSCVLLESAVWKAATSGKKWNSMFRNWKRKRRDYKRKALSVYSKKVERQSLYLSRLLQTHLRQSFLAYLLRIPVRLYPLTNIFLPQYHGHQIWIIALVIKTEPSNICIDGRSLFIVQLIHYYKLRAVLRFRTRGKPSLRRRRLALDRF